MDQDTVVSESIRRRLELSAIGFPREGSGRDRIVDALKGYAILLVVLGHCLELADPGVMVPNASFRHHLFALIYAFHMPLFMFLSGYVMFKKRVNVGRSFLRLIVPFLVWQAVRFVATVHEWGEFGAYMWNGIYDMQNALWFLWALFICHLLLMGVQRAPGRWKYGEELGFAVAFLAVNLLVFHTILGVDLRHFGLPQAAYLFAFFALGYLARKYLAVALKWSARARAYALAAATGVFVTVFAYAYWNVDLVAPVPISDAFARPTFFLVRYCLPVLGILASVGLVLLIRRMNLGSLIAALAWMGLVTLDLYASHGILMLVSFGDGWVKVTSGFIAALGLGLALTYVLLRNSRYLSYPFLGRSFLNGPRYRLRLAPVSAIPAEPPEQIAVGSGLES